MPSLKLFFYHSLQVGIREGDGQNAQGKHSLQQNGPVLCRGGAPTCIDQTNGVRVCVQLNLVILPGYFTEYLYGENPWAMFHTKVLSQISFQIVKMY